MSGRRLPGLIFLAAMTVSGPGCLGAGGFMGGMVYPPGAVRSCHDFPTTFRDTWLAAHQAMQDLQLEVIAEQNNGASGFLSSKAQNGAVVSINITTQPRPIPIDGLITRVCIRVGTFGDQETSDRILSRLAERLAQVVAPATGASAPSPAPPAAPAAAQVMPPTAVQSPPISGQKPADVPLRPIVISPAVSTAAPRNGQ